jgi:hypothetical protein
LSLGLLSVSHRIKGRGLRRETGRDQDGKRKALKPTKKGQFCLLFTPSVWYRRCWYILQCRDLFKEPSSRSRSSRWTQTTKCAQHQTFSPYLL